MAKVLEFQLQISPSSKHSGLISFRMDWLDHLAVQGTLKSLQLLSCVQLFYYPMDCSMPGLPVHHQLPILVKLLSIESMMPSNHLVPCCPLFLLPSIFPSIRVFSRESVLHIRWPKYWSFSFSISPSNEYLGLISFRIDWLDLRAVQANL